MSHPAEESLIAYAAGEAEGISLHVEACPECLAEAESYREMFSVGETAGTVEPPAAVLGVASRLEQEEPAATAAIEEIRSTPVSRWKATLADHRTIGMVRALWNEANDGRSDAAESRALVELARDIAVRLTDYPEALLTRTRAHAWREVSYACYVVGDFNAALDAGHRAVAELEGVAGAEFDLARIQLTMALALKSLDRVDEGIALVDGVAPVFAQHGETKRFLTAMSILGTMQFRKGDFRSAHETYSQVRNHPFTQSDPALVAMATHNIGLTLLKLERFEEAEAALLEALAASHRLGMRREEVGSRWALARLMMAVQDYDAAMEALLEARAAFANLHMRGEARFATVEIIELLLLSGDARGAHQEATSLLQELSAAGLSTTIRARTAMALLREAAEQNSVTPELIEDVGGYLRNVVAAAHPQVSLPA